MPAWLRSRYRCVRPGEFRVLFRLIASKPLRYERSEIKWK